MTSKLSVVCDKIIEAEWLAAVVLAPLFFNGYTSAVMHEGKLAILRMLAVTMVAMWLVKWLEERRVRRTQAPLPLHSPLALAVLLLVGMYLLTTLTAIDLHTALFGSYLRPLGLHGFLTYVVMFVMLAQGLRTRQQLDRLIAAIILPSFPIALYSILQRSGLDPLAWTVEFDGRVGAQLGNPIFLAGYLIMVFALTLGQIVIALRSCLIEKEADTRAADISRAASYSVIAIAQFVAIFLSGSRGPWLGMFGGMVFFLLCLALVLGRRRMVLGAIGLGFAGLAFLLIFNLPNTPLQGLRTLPGFGRLGQLADSTAGFRLYTWENVARLVLPHAPIQFPMGAPDSLNVVRPLVGYGADTLVLIYRQLALPDPYSPLLQTDRSHNETWDILVTTGLGGFGAHQFLWLCLFGLALRGLGLAPTNRTRNLFVGLWVALMLSGGLGALLLNQAKYLGLILPASNLAAVSLYLAWFALRQDAPPAMTHRPQQILLAALLAGLVAHYIESQFGPNMIATQTLFWIFAGMLVVVAKRLQFDRISIPHLQAARSLSRVPTWIGSVSSYALIVALILAILIFEFVTIREGTTDAPGILWQALSFNPVLGITSYVVLALLAVVWLLSTLVVWSEMLRARILSFQGDGRRGLMWVAALSAGLAICFELGLALQLSTLASIPRSGISTPDALIFFDRTVGVVDYFMVSASALILCTAIGIAIESGAATMPRIANKWSLAALVPLIVVTGMWVTLFDLNPTRSDMAYRLGKTFADQGRQDAAIVIGQRALHLSPAADQYYRVLGRALVEKANTASANATPRHAANAAYDAQISVEQVLLLDPRAITALGRTDLLYAAQAMLLRARELNPLYVDHTLNLARLYLPELPVNTPAKTQLVERAGQLYSQAIRLNPNDARLWNEVADFDLVYGNDSDAALQKLGESRARDNKLAETYLYLGKAYATKKDFAKASEAYQQAVALQPQFAEAHSKLAFVYYRQGMFAQAIQEYRNYIELAPNSSYQWEAHTNLALLYQQTGDFPKALSAAQIAMRTAPSEEVPSIQKLVALLRAQSGLH